MITIELAYLKEHWKRGDDGDIEARIRSWDSVAEDYVYDGSVTLENDPFLRLLQQKLTLTPEMEVLDVGCGAGAYSLAIAPRVHRTVGVDYSPKMIETAKRCAKDSDIENAEFLKRDWYAPDDGEFAGKFDLVFAHTTPAVADYVTFQKMMDASRRYCLFCKPARRHDKVFGELRGLLGRSQYDHDIDVAYAFSTIWNAGFNPELSYQKTIWRSKKPMADAEKWYLGRLNGEKRLTSTEEAQARAYLEQISRDGVVEDETHTTLVNFFWEVIR